MSNIYDCEHYTDSIYYQLEQTAKYCRFLGMQIFQKLNVSVTMDEFVTMDTILAHDGICQRDLAKLILKDRPSTGRILNSLEDKGYVERFVDTKNNRLVRKMTLTPEGRQETERVSVILKDYIAKLPKIFTDKDRQELTNSIVRFRENLKNEVEIKI